MTASATAAGSHAVAAVHPVPVSAPAVAGARLRRFAVMAMLVGLWMSIGWALDLGAVAYLLTGVPLTVVFQRVIARRPIRTLWLVDGRPFRLDRIGIVIATGLAIVPLYAVALGVASGRILDVGYGLVGVLGAGPAAFALRAIDRAAGRALLRSMVTAGLVAAALFLANRIVSSGPPMSDVAGGLGAFAISLVLYVPMVFVIEEVFFRGALDAYAQGSGRSDDMPSAIFVSLLWGVWHLPLVLEDDGLSTLPVTLGFHLIVGLLLTLPWRRSGNLAVPGMTHAVIDAIRDGLAAA